MSYRRDLVIFGLLAIVMGALMITRLRTPAYTDGYYYFNAGRRLATGSGLTDAAIWTYLGLPDGLRGLPVPSHLYWMPLTSLVAAGGMLIGGGTFDAGRLPFIPIFAGLGLAAFVLGAQFGGSRRAAWMAGLLTLFGGYFMPFWMNTDTFALYGLTGALALLTMGLGRRSGDPRWFAVSGLFAGLAHLTRADGLLLIGVLVVVALWPRPTANRPAKIALCVLLGILAYLLVMAPWFIRNMNAIGTILPTGGFQTAWLRQYDEIFNYPPGVRFADFAASGIGSILSSRLRGITFGLENLVSVEGLVVLAPLMLLGLWRRRADPLLSGFILYAIGLHLAMALIFPLPGENGGLWHSSAALMPFWMALGVAGLDDVLAWAARRRRWRLQQAQTVFSSALMAWAIGFSLFIFNGQTAGANAAGGYFTGLTAYLPPDAVVMINDPSALYYYTGRSGIRLPTAVPDVIPDLARRFGVNYVVLDVPGTPAPLWDLFSGTNVPPFLTPVYRTSRVVIYKINS